LSINVHPICDAKSKATYPKILHTGVVAVTWHPAWPKAGQDIHVWPYALTHHLKDDWGYSVGPPIVAGVVALIKSANPALTPRELKSMIVKTAFANDGFRVLDAEAALKAAIQRREQ
jgi:subtilisin family serine protease